MGEQLSIPYPGSPFTAVSNEVGCKCQIVCAC
ncbi:Uncharacterised protein [Escherichia coli]|uniref:Uncharacterized protein n=1 Tax=Escherichia coli TaxID=562 RepID=A0A377D6V2_ECOLX|nr:Uncharacterised protein [Escherichia coli]